MKNNEQQILNEIRTMMASIRQQMELLDAKMAELQQITRSEDEVVAPIVLDIDAFDLPVEETPEALSVEGMPETLQAEEVSEDLPAEEISEEVPVEEVAEDLPVEEEPSDDLPFDLPAEVTPVEEPIPAESVSEPVVEDLPEEIILEVPADPTPVVPADPAPTVIAGSDRPTDGIAEANAKESPAEEPAKPVVKEAIIDAMTEKQAWRTDMPGTQVKDVRLAISLHERVLFINHLFSEDPMAFQTAVNKVNASASLDEVVEYVKETFPQWDLDSDLVYRFMMAVRRKIR